MFVIQEVLYYNRVRGDENERNYQKRSEYT
jgi:hypothetical protein